MQATEFDGNDRVTQAASPLDSSRAWLAQVFKFSFLTFWTYTPRKNEPFCVEQELTFQQSHDSRLNFSDGHSTTRGRRMKESRDSYTKVVLPKKKDENPEEQRRNNAAYVFCCKNAGLLM